MNLDIGQKPTTTRKYQSPLELKAEGGRLTEAQEHVLIKLRAAGATATHAHGLDQALRILECWGLLQGRSS